MYKTYRCQNYSTTTTYYLLFIHRHFQRHRHQNITLWASFFTCINWIMMLMIRKQDPAAKYFQNRAAQDSGNPT